MTMVVEDGSGIVDANSYASVAWTNTYFADRGNTSWTGADEVKEAALIAATDYIDKRFGSRFQGFKKYTNQKKAKATFVMTAQSITGDTVTIGADTFAFEPGALFLDTLTALITAVNDDSDYEAEQGLGLSMIVMAPMEGPEGDTIEVSTTSTSGTWISTNLKGGSFEGVDQALAFPRLYCYTREGYEVTGVPKAIREATAEYALRALSASLLPDPTVGPSGQIIQRTYDKVGPIETEVEYMAGIMNSLGLYPAVDVMLKEFFVNNGSGGVYR